MQDNKLSKLFRIVSELGLSDKGEYFLMKLLASVEDGRKFDSKDMADNGLLNNHAYVRTMEAMIDAGFCRQIGFSKRGRGRPAQVFALTRKGAGVRRKIKNLGLI